MTKQERLLNTVGGASFGALYGAICGCFIAFAGFGVEVISLFFLATVTIGGIAGLIGRPKFWGR